MLKEDVVYISKGTLLSHEKDGLMPPSAILMDLEDIMLNDITWRKTKNCDFMLMWDIRKQTQN